MAVTYNKERRPSGWWAWSRRLDGEGYPFLAITGPLEPTLLHHRGIDGIGLCMGICVSSEVDVVAQGTCCPRHGPGKRGLEFGCEDEI